MNSSLLKALLKTDFYSEHKYRLKASIFDGLDKEVFTTIAHAHERDMGDMSSEDILAIWRIENPVATLAEVHDVQTCLMSVDMAVSLNSNVAHSTIESLWRHEVGRDIANLGISMAEGNIEAMASLQSLLASIADGYMPDEYGDPVTDDLYELLSSASDDNRWEFNIPTLSRHVYGIGATEFGIVFARPETGKSAFIVSIMAGPNGFCAQGAKVLYLGNEEAVRRTKLRAYLAWTGMDVHAINNNIDLARTRFASISERLVMKDTQDWDISMLDGYIAKHKPDVVIIDQADKVNVAGTYNSSHEKLRELYRRLRELAKRHECALIGVSQASADAENKTRLDFSMLEGSKTGKAAEADLIIGIGKHNGTDKEEPDPTRFLTVSKNKLSGWHGTIVCQLNSATSRYEA